MEYTDDNGDGGLYTGHVNSQYKPHGSGKMIYNDGKRFSGEWCEGTKVHGKTSTSSNDKSKMKTKEKREKQKNGTGSSSKEKGVADKQSSEKKQAALKEYKDLYNTAQVVKNMMFVDFYGDRGRYTGEVNEDKMPHGYGQITYDHGLVQEGKWVSTLCDRRTLFHIKVHY